VGERVQVDGSAFSGSRVPASERFFPGGGNSLRGFRSRAGPQRLVPVCPAGTTQPTATTTSVFRWVEYSCSYEFSELRFPIPVKNNLGGVIFYDGGNVYQTYSLGDLIDNYTNDVGFGIR